jgi:glycosyltransferase involved in cell wall biosynthesis
MAIVYYHCINLLIVKFSFVIPLFNAEKHLTTFFENTKLFETTTDRVEFIFVDNNSTDSTLNCLRDFLEDFVFEYQILQESKRGAGNARNLGILNSNNEIIRFWDIDDNILFNDIIEVEEIFQNRNNIHFIFNETIRQYSDGTLLLQKTPNTNNTKMPFWGELWIKDLLYMPHIGNVFIRKSIIMKHSLFFSDLRIGEDYIFLIKLGFVSNGYFTGKLNYRYLKTMDGTISRINQKSKYLFEFQQSIILLDFLKAESFKLAFIDEALKLNIKLLKLKHSRIAVEMKHYAINLLVKYEPFSRLTKSIYKNPIYWLLKWRVL